MNDKGVSLRLHSTIFYKLMKNVLEFDGYADKIFHRHQGKLHLNLALLNYLQTKELGVPEKNIDHFPFCTRCDKKRFFSFRRDKKQDYGEMFSFIVMN